MRRQDEGHAALLEPVQAVPDHVPGLRVEARRRLVEEHQVRLVDQRSRHREPALHAARQRLDLVVGALGELDEVEELLRPPAGLPARQPEIAAVDHEVVLDRELRVEGVLLRHDADPGPDPRPVTLCGPGPRTVSSPSVTGETQPIMRIVEVLPALPGPGGT